MIAASAWGVHALIVASADSLVGCGGLAEKPMRNVRDGNCDCVLVVVDLQPARPPRVNSRIARETNIRASTVGGPRWQLRRGLERESRRPNNPVMSIEH